MSRRNSGWRWRRSISRADEPLWQERMSAAAGQNWMIVEKPGRVRLTAEVYLAQRATAQALCRLWGGRVRRVDFKPPRPPAPVRVSAQLEIVHDPLAKRRAGRLLIPYGIAFGSGEHATTLLLLRALAGRRDLGAETILDLGTGSGVLALAARVLGARRVTASDFDPDAIRTARENERLNFDSRRVRWEVADVKKLRGRATHSLILANLYSEILIQAAPRVARALAPGGELWLSGVLRAQADDVATAYRAAALRHLGTKKRGKWVMEQWTKPAPTPN